MYPSQLKTKLCARLLFPLLAAAVLWAFATKVPGQSQPSSDDSLLSITSIQNLRTGESNKLGLGDRINIDVQGSTTALDRATSDPRKIVLLLGGIAFRGLCTNATIITNTAVTNDAPKPAVVTTNVGHLQFVLERNETNRAEWANLLGAPQHTTRNVSLEIGLQPTGSVATLTRTPREVTLVLLPMKPLFDDMGAVWIKPLALFLTVASLAVLLRQGLRRKTLESVLEGWIWIAWGIFIVSIYFCLGPTWCWVAFAGLFLFGFYYLATRTEIIRDSGPPPPGDGLRPYSLARTQMAIWFFLSISAFVFIWLMTGALDSVTGTVLALMGIGAGTALGAEAQESGRMDKLKAEKERLEKKQQTEQLTPDETQRLKDLAWLSMDIAGFVAEQKNLKRLLALPKKINELPAPAEFTTLQQKQAADLSAEEKTKLKKAVPLLKRRIDLESELQGLKTKYPSVSEAEAQARIQEIDNLLSFVPTSEGFFEDVLTDDVGISFHRFQMFVWTLVLGVIFISSVYRQLAMPEFNTTLLALMGISSGTYLGFKIAERPADTKK